MRLSGGSVVSVLMCGCGAMTGLQERLHQLNKMAAKYAKAKADMEYLDHFRKSQLAILMKEYETKGFTTSASQDTQARADERYLEILYGLQEATETAERLGWELRIAMKGADLYQTEQANRRAEMKHLGSVA